MVVVALALAFVGCLFFVEDIYNFLLFPMERAAGEHRQSLHLIYTAPQEFFFAQIKLALYGGLFISFPVIMAQLYRFIAPGLYKNERRTLVPFLIASPLLFLVGAVLVYTVIMPLALTFFFAMEQQGTATTTAISLTARVSEYLSFTMSLMVGFGLCFQLPVVLTLLAKTGVVKSSYLKAKRPFAIVGIFALAAVLTPPDLISQIGLAIPTIFLYELSIHLVTMVEKKNPRRKKTPKRHTAPKQKT